LSLFGRPKDSLWSIDILRCESLFFATHWILVVMDQCTRRIIDFAVQSEVVDEPAVCHLLGRILARAGNAPSMLSSNHDPLFQYRRGKANLPNGLYELPAPA
jgi:hypothetical protein